MLFGFVVFSHHAFFLSHKALYWHRFFSRYNLSARHGRAEVGEDEKGEHEKGEDVCVNSSFSIPLSLPP